MLGEGDRILRRLRSDLSVEVLARGTVLEIAGPAPNVAAARQVLRELAALAGRPEAADESDVESILRLAAGSLNETGAGSAPPVMFGRRSVRARSGNQARYLEALHRSSMVFGIGPAGTGKTYLAMAVALEALLSKAVTRIVLARPAVEAGERLGFLPGTMQEKVDPYLRPLFDALHDMVEPERAEQLLARGSIEIAPLAYMRGRTLNRSFIVLDEAQNTTPAQMKMFITRLGEGSRAVISGDITQIDLPPREHSGLVDAVRVLKGVPGIEFVHFDERDVVRHPLLVEILKAYEGEHGRLRSVGDGGGRK